MNFQEKYYEEYRELLVHYGYRFDHSLDTAEDLFEEAHLAICLEYDSLPEGEEYVKLIKTAMKNKYRDLSRHQKVLTDHPILPKVDLPVDEQVFRKLELTVVHRVLSALTPSDRAILLSDLQSPTMRQRSKKYRANLHFVNYYLQNPTEEFRHKNESYPL